MGSRHRFPAPPPGLNHPAPRGPGLSLLPLPLSFTHKPRSICLVS